MSRQEEIKNWMVDQGLGDKYNHPGLYCIKIAGKLVYIGKSLNMLDRISSHIVHIEYPQKSHKYQILHQAREKGYDVEFDVIYYSKAGWETVEQDIGENEGRLIRYFRPALNYQIPKEGDYTHYTVNKRAKYVSLEEILELEPEGFIF